MLYDAANHYLNQQVANHTEKINPKIDIHVALIPMECG